MGTLESSLLISVIIRAIDGASSVLAALGLNGLGALNPLTIGALGVAAAIGGIGIGAAKAATDFDYNMQKIAALTDTSAAQMQNYKQQLLDMAPALDQTPTALAQGLYFVISAGYSGADALNVLKLSAQAAASTMTPMQKVADLLTTAMNAYRGSNVTAGHAMDDLINTVVQGKVTMSSLATSMGFVLVTAKAAGLSIDQASAAVSTLSQVAGEHGSRRVMMDLDNAMRGVAIQAENVSKKAEKMKGLKAPWDAAAFAAMNFMQKLQYIAQETGGVGYLDKTQAAAYEATGNMQNLAQATAHANTNFMSLVGGAAAFIPAAMLLSDKGAEYNKILATMGGNGQKTAQAFDTMRQSVGQQINMLKVAGTTILTILGEHLLPVLNQLLGFFYRIAQGIIAFTQSTAGINALKYALLGISIVVGAILLPILAHLAVGLALAFAPFAAIIGAGVLLGIIIKALVAHFGGWQKILKDIQPILTVVKNLFTQAGQQIKKALADPAIAAAWKQLEAALPKLLPIIKGLAIALGGALFVAFKAVEAGILLLIKVLPVALNLVTGLINFLMDHKAVLVAIGSVIGAIAAVMIGSGIIAAITTVVTTIGGLIAVIGTVVAAVGGFGAVLATVGGIIVAVVTAPVVLITAAIAALIFIVVMVITHWKQLGELMGHVGEAISGVLGGIGNAIGSFLGGIGSTIGGFFSSLGTTIHNGLNVVLGIFGTVFHAIGNFFPWLYNHNYYVKALVDFIRNAFTRARQFLGTILNGIKTLLGDAWNAIKTVAQDDWNLVYQHIIQPVQQAWTWVTGKVGQLVSWLQGAWNTVKGDAQQAWTNFVNTITGIAGKIGTAVQNNVIKPITDAIGKLISNALDWAHKMMDNFIKGIKDKLGDLGNAAKGALSAVGGFLGFHSPPPKAPETAQWAPNLIRMFSTGLLSSAPMAARAAAQVLAAVSGAMSGAIGGAAAGGAGMGAAAGASLAGAAAGGGGTSITHNWAGAFPNATNRKEIEAAIQRVQQTNYRRARRGGSYGGARAGIDHFRAL